MPRRHANRRRRPARKHGMKRRLPRRTPTVANKGQSAHIIETIEFVDLNPNQVYQSVFQLAQFPRASQLAGSFAFYKAASVEWTYEPLYNTFQDSVGGISKPYMYTLMNRQQENAFVNINTQNFQAIQAAGAKPVALASTRKVKYTPNWCSPGLTARTAGGDPFSSGLQKQYSWLSTPTGSTSTDVSPSNNVVVRPIDPPIQSVGLTVVGNYANAVVYNGHLTYLDQKIRGTGDAPAICRATCTVKWLFKGAACRFVAPVPPPPPTLTEA